MPAERVDVTVDGRTISVSSPAKPYFPELGPQGTKLTLVEYYAAVAPQLFHALENRPTYLQRYPEGITGEEVYQKRIPPKAPDWLQRVRIQFPGGRSANALLPTHPAALIWAAQYGTITFHPWPALGDDLEHPDLMRIDLDPQPGTDFSDAASVAVEVLVPLLEGVGLVGFPKTSGKSWDTRRRTHPTRVDVRAGSTLRTGTCSRDGTKRSGSSDLGLVEGGAR